MHEASGEAMAARFTFDAICAPRVNRVNRVRVRNRARLRASPSTRGVCLRVRPHRLALALPLPLLLPLPTGGQPLGPDDYLKIAKTYATVFIEHVPPLTLSQVRA